jgi:hypothetical protein
MLPFISQVNLIRYLIVWQVTGPFVQLPRHFAADISQTLGTLIAESLPTQQARPWRRWQAVEGARSLRSEDALPAGRAEAKPRPRAARGASQRAPGGAEASQRAALHAGTSWPAWPIETVIWAYPGKRGYGQGEPILWELKLLGNDADHGVFLELILPAMETAATTSDERWRRQRALWGRFDIQSVYVGRGPRWEPIVQDRRLDLGYRVTPAQWADGLTLDEPSKQRQRRLAWLTPFELDAQEPTLDPLPEKGEDEDEAAAAGLPALRIPRPSTRTPAPTLRVILDVLMARLAPLATPGAKRATAEQAWALLTPEEQVAVWLDCEEGRLAKVNLERSDKDAPGHWIGEQTFTKIPPRLAPYLELAAALHIGQHTHFGCGTFTFV